MHPHSDVLDVHMQDVATLQLSLLQYGIVGGFGVVRGA